MSEPPLDGSDRSGKADGRGPTWLGVATRADVVRRACVYALIVGTILLTINHLPSIVRGEMDVERVLQIALTYCVPYAVTTFASVQAIRGERGR